MPKRYSKNRRKALRVAVEAQWAVGGIWSIASVEREPETILDSWHVFELQLPGKTERTRHFAGCTGWWREGRVSSAITEFDPATMRGITENGRAYRLTRSRGFTSDGECTWRRWCDVCGVVDIVDVTAEIWAQIPQPTEAEVAEKKAAFEGQLAKARALMQEREIGGTDA